MPLMLSTTPKVTPMAVLPTGTRYGPTLSLMSLSYCDCTWFGYPLDIHTLESDAWITQVDLVAPNNRMATERWQALPPNSLLDIYYRLSQVNRLGQRTKSYQSERD